MIHKNYLTATNNNDAITLDFGEAGTLQVRSSIDQASQEVISDFVTSHLIDGHSYIPLRKDVLMGAAFVQYFVLDSEGLLMTDDAGNTDLFATYDLVVSRLDIITKARAASPSIAAILDRIEASVDKQIDHVLRYVYAMVPSTTDDETVNAIKQFNTFVEKASSVLDSAKDLVDTSGKKLLKLLTPKNVEAITELLNTVKPTKAG